MMQESEIQRLVKQAQTQDQDAFGQLYDTYAQPVFNFLLGKIRHRETAEDILSTVFLKAWQNLASYSPRPNAKFSTWLYQIASNTLIDHWRTSKPSVELDAVENLSQFAIDPQHYEEYAYLWDAVAKLPKPYQIILDLRFRQDLSVEESAIILGKTRVGIRVLQHRALKALQSKLKGYV